MTSTRPDPSRTGKLQRLFGLAAGQAGCFTAAQARELGCSARSLVHHVAAGHLERISRGFYRLVGVPAGPHENIEAAEEAPSLKHVAPEVGLIRRSHVIDATLSASMWAALITWGWTNAAVRESR
jgi:predicted transcriptional regulator of viral defense system